MFNLNDWHTTAHRIMYALAVNPVPKGMDVLHRCDNPACVNPEHLFLGSHADNMRDMVLKGRHPPEHARAVKLTRQQDEQIRSDYATGDITQTALAAQYGVSQPQIWYIAHARVWK
jgi:hypothetical protein